jgi:hypothetical protein
MSDQPPASRSEGLTPNDIAQIIEGIELFIIGGDPAVREVWQPYIDKLQALRDDIDWQECGEIAHRHALEKKDWSREAANPFGKPMHVCGLKGYDPMRDPACPACERAKPEVPHE